MRRLAVGFVSILITTSCGALPNGPGVASSPRIQVSPTPSSASPPSALAACSLSGAPDARMAASAAYGPETWLWNGSQWAMTSPAHSPSARTGERMAFVTTSKQVLLFGGYASGLGYLNDTWIWDGVDWHKPTVSDAPSGRVSPTLVSGPQVVLFGGCGGRCPP